MTTSADIGRLVVLCPGTVVPLRVLQLAWTLQGQGFQFSVDGAFLKIRPGHVLTVDDKAALRAVKPDMLALITHEARTLARL
jgi:hypothetical protein